MHFVSIALVVFVSVNVGLAAKSPSCSVDEDVCHLVFKNHETFVNLVNAKDGEALGQLYEKNAHGIFADYEKLGSFHHWPTGLFRGGAKYCPGFGKMKSTIISVQKLNEHTVIVKGYFTAKSNSVPEGQIHYGIWEQKQSILPEKTLIKQSILTIQGTAPAF